jgi:hypothetical protein
MEREFVRSVSYECAVALKRRTKYFRLSMLADKSMLPSHTTNEISRSKTPTNSALSNIYV